MPPNDQNTAMQTIDITCQDGTRLKGHFLPAHAGQQSATHDPVLLCPATGVKQRFAAHLRAD